VIDRAKILAVVGLGRNTFLPHTHQKASILFLQRRFAGERRLPQEKIFFAVSEKEGKDSKGDLQFLPEAPATGPLWNRVDHDLAGVLQAFHEHVSI
jgi:type I restriction enzyme M protein